MSYNRIDRISEEVRREVDRIIREDVNDPRTNCTFSVTHADVTRDLRHAKIYHHNTHHPHAYNLNSHKKTVLFVEQIIQYVYH